MTRYRTGHHWGVTIVAEGDGPVLPDDRRPGDELVAVVVNGDTALAERIVRGLHLLALSEALPPKQCEETVWSSRFFPADAVDAYWITCDRRGDHDEHEDEHTGLTWRTEPGA